jgi:pimeloyl-ACP methyl ester carboxylesterase
VTAQPSRWLPRSVSRLIVVNVLVVSFLGCAGISVKHYAVLDREELESPASGSAATSEAIGLIQAGRQIERSHPETAISYYREAALAVFPELLRKGVSIEPGTVDPNGPQRTYRRAIEYAALVAERQAKSEGTHWTKVLAKGGIGVRGYVGGYSPERWSEVEPARSFRVSGLRHMNARDGLGAPLLLSRRLPPNPPPPESHFPHIMCNSAETVLRPGVQEGDPPAILELNDPIAQPSMVWIPPAGGTPIPLAYDITTPLARQFQDTKLSLIGPLTVFFPSSFDGRAGIYMIDPYDPEKIPVIFVHGLMSSPLAWTNAMNDLRGDPALRERYQFWMFFYSTGNSIAKSAAHLRTSLSEIQAEYDPTGNNPNFNRTVLIGHSMGGLLSRIAVSSSGESVWKAIFKVPPEELDIKPEYRSDLFHLTHFDPVPMISRVVFISTPHQGSPLGDALIGRISSSLIRLPSNVEELRDAILKNQMYTKIKPEFMKNRQLTSIAQLGQQNPIISIIGGLRISEKVPYHSIIGYDGKEPLPGGGDGVVPYESAHLDGAMSELVVTSDHSAQETQPAIVEMRRILRLHLAEGDAAIDAMAHGEQPAFRVTRPEGPTPIRYELTPPARPPELMTQSNPEGPENEVR